MSLVPTGNGAGSELRKAGPRRSAGFDRGRTAPWALRAAWAFAVPLLGGCAGGDERTAGQEAGPAVQLAAEESDAFVGADSARVMAELRFLSSDSLLGRRTGEPGNVAARGFILEAFQDAGLREPGGGFVQPFEFRGRRNPAQVTRGANVVGFLQGREPDLGAIVLTAHFDHLGVRPRPPRASGEAGVDSIYNGADDNASGTVALLSIARYMAEHPPRHTMVFAALDGEEIGMRGARAFLETGWPSEIVLNVNMDMVSRSDSLLFIAGPSHYPQLRPILETVPARSPVALRFGHDRPGEEGVDDWTGSSDHGVFHEAGIPFVYFGVEDHEDYHRPSDEFDRVDPAFFINAIRTILAGVLTLDEHIGPPATGAPGEGEVPRGPGEAGGAMVGG